MASITFRKSTKYGTEPYAILKVTQGSQDTELNTTTISYSLKLYRPSNVISSVKKDYSITIDGTTIRSGTYSIGGSGTKTIASGSRTIAHNEDGTKTLSFGASVEFGVTWSGTSIGTITKSSSMTLTPIDVTASMSTLELSTYQVLADGTSPIVATAIPKSAGVTDAITMTFGSYTTNLTSGENFIIPIEWNNAVPTDSDYGIAIVTLTTTDSDGAVVGTVSKEVEIYMPEPIGKPSDDISATISRTPLSSEISLVQPSLFKYGATFASWSVEITSESATAEVTADNVITITRESDDDKTIWAYIKAVDSRGFVTKTITIPVYGKKKGVCVFDGVWMPAAPYVYKDGNYVKMSSAVYQNGWRNIR